MWMLAQKNNRDYVEISKEMFGPVRFLNENVRLVEKCVQFMH